MYKDIGDAAVGEELLREREPLNAQDQYAVAVKREGIIVGHLPRKISRLRSLFLRQGGVLLYSNWRNKVLRRFTSMCP